MEAAPHLRLLATQPLPRHSKQIHVSRSTSHIAGTMKVLGLEVQRGVPESLAIKFGQDRHQQGQQLLGAAFKVEEWTVAPQRFNHTFSTSASAPSTSTFTRWQAARPVSIESSD